MLPRELTTPNWIEVERLLGAPLSTLVQRERLTITLSHCGWVVTWRSRPRSTTHERRGLASTEDCALAILQVERARKDGSKASIPWSKARNGVMYLITNGDLKIYAVKANDCGETVHRSDRPGVSSVHGTGFWSWSTPPGFYGQVETITEVGPVAIPTTAPVLREMIHAFEDRQHV